MCVSGDVNIYKNITSNEFSLLYLPLNICLRYESKCYSTKICTWQLSWEIIKWLQGICTLRMFWTNRKLHVKDSRTMARFSTFLLWYTCVNETDVCPVWVESVHSCWRSGIDAAEECYRSTKRCLKITARAERKMFARGEFVVFKYYGINLFWINVQL